MIGSTVYTAQWTLSALYRRPGKGFPYRFSAILLGCVFFFFVFFFFYWFVVCFFFCMGRPAATVLLAAGCWMSFYIIRWIRRCVAIDPYRQLSSILFGRRLSLCAVRISSDVVRQKREQTGAHGARETAAYIA